MQNRMNPEVVKRKVRLLDRIRLCINDCLKEAHEGGLEDPEFTPFFKPIREFRSLVEGEIAYLQGDEGSDRLAGR